MASNPEQLKKVNPATAKGPTTTTSNAGAVASTTAKSAAKPVSGSGAPLAIRTSAKPANAGGAAATIKPSTSTSTSSKAGTGAAAPIRTAPKTDAPPDWGALIKKATDNGPKLNGEQINEDDWRASLLFSIKRRDSQTATTYAAHAKRSVGVDGNKK